MGREIRRVPPNWEHPKNDYGNYIPMHDETFDFALENYYQNYMAWKNKTHEGYSDEYSFSDYEGEPPISNCFRPEFKEEPTWYQVYETVSEGTPVTPPFETKEELVEYLVNHGTFWDERRVRDGRQDKVGWDRESAEQFAEYEWAPSGTVTREGIKTLGDKGFFPKKET